LDKKSAKTSCCRNPFATKIAPLWGAVGEFGIPGEQAFSHMKAILFGKREQKATTLPSIGRIESQDGFCGMGRAGRWPGGSDEANTALHLGFAIVRRTCAPCLGSDEDKMPWESEKALLTCLSRLKREAYSK